MASKYDWDFIRPLDQTSAIANMASGNQQINAGLQGMGGAVTGFADAMKQRNTDDIMNALYQAQTSADLPQAMQAVQALQQQYGRGYDQNAVRSAVDTRGSTLGQRDLQAINLQQAQAAQAALPQLNQAAIAQAKARGVDTTAMEALAGLGIDTTGQINTYANNSISDTRDARDYKDKRDDITYNRNYQTGRDKVTDAQWAEGNNRANISAMASLAENYKTDPTSGYSVDANGNITTTGTSGVSFADAMGLMPSIFNTESNNTHRTASGGLVTSPKGALGVAQIMPATAAKPGYGMKPINLHTSSADEQKAWATEYIGNIQKAHNFTTEQAVAAYNAGSGAVQKAIKAGGSNWLSKLPAETRAYVPKVMGGATGGGGSRATQAIGPVVSQANMSRATADYKTGLAKLEGDFASAGINNQTKGSLATTGKSVDTWAASNRGKDSTFFTNAGDLAKMAKADPGFNKLPEDAKVNILDGAFAKMNDVNFAQYVPDGDLKKFISRESQNYQNDRLAKHTQDKKNLEEQAYQSIVQQYQAVGAQPPNRASVMQMLNPQSAPSKAKEATKAVAPPVVKKSDNPSFSEPSTATKAVQAVSPNKTNQVPAKAPTKAETDKRIMSTPGTRLTASEKQRRSEIMVERHQASIKQEQDAVKNKQDNLARKRADVAKADADRKVREREAANQRAKERLAKEQADKQNKGTPKAPTNDMFKGIGSTGGKSISQAELNEILKKLKTG